MLRKAFTCDGVDLPAGDKEYYRIVSSRCASVLFLSVFLRVGLHRFFGILRTQPSTMAKLPGCRFRRIADSVPVIADSF
jgi:hypothetical protein